MKATIRTDKVHGRIDDYWTKCVGSCHAATALREDWRKQLRKCRNELGFEYVRFHGLLNDDMSVCVRNENGAVEYSFFNVDSIFDFLLSIGMKPFIELSFMPTALASGTKTVFHYRGNITPPSSYSDWADLVRSLASHLVGRYGVKEVGTWYFEVWNEPNLDIFWSGSMEEYFQLYRHAASAVKDVDPSLQVGGPATAIDAWIPEFRDFCRSNDVALDFISTHHYPTDASYGLGLNMEEQMARAKRGVLTERVTRALEESGPLPLFYTEWNNSPSPRDPYHDTAYNAAFIAKTLIDNVGALQCYSFWTFSDIFEEAGLSSVPFHGGFGLLNIHGIPKPSYRTFELLSRVVGERLEIAFERTSPTVDCTASRTTEGIVVLITNHTVPLALISEEQMTVTLRSAPHVRSAYVERIDEAHANPKRRWEQMGKPNYPDDAALNNLMRESELLREPVALTLRDGDVTAELTVQPHSVTLLTFLS